MAKKRPYQAQGAALKNARKERPMSQIQSALNLTSVQVYLNWEKGYNRPDPDKWAELGRFLGIDVAALYTGTPSKPRSKDAPQVVSADAVRQIVTNMKKSLRLLEDIVGKAATTEAVEKAGFVKIRYNATEKAGK